MTREEIRQIVQQVFAEEEKRRGETEDTLVLKTVSAILTGFGINDDDRKEIRADMAHLRRWRIATEQVQATGWKVVVTVLITGFLGILLAGLKIALGK